MEISIILNNKVVKEFTGKDILKSLSKQVALTLMFMMVSKKVFAAGPIKVVSDEVFNLISTPEYSGPPLKCFFPLDWEIVKYLGPKTVQAFKNDMSNAVRCFKIINGGY